MALGSLVLSARRRPNQAFSVVDSHGYDSPCPQPLGNSAPATLRHCLTLPARNASQKVSQPVFLLLLRRRVINPAALVDGPRGVDLPMPMLPMPMPRPVSTWPAWLGHDYCSDYRCPPARALHTTTHVSMAAGLGIKVSTAFLFVRRAGNPIPYPLPASALPLLCACSAPACSVPPLSPCPHYPWPDLDLSLHFSLQESLVAFLHHSTPPPLHHHSTTTPPPLYHHSTTALPPLSQPPSPPTTPSQAPQHPPHARPLPLSLGSPFSTSPNAKDRRYHQQ
jgi:hypothetical protein